MQFEMAFIPALLLTGTVYMLVAAGLLKNNIKQVYSRRTKREKFLSIGVVVLAVVTMLLVAPRQGPLLSMGEFSIGVNGAILWILNGSKDILAMAAYLVCALPVIVISAAVMDEIAQKHIQIELPFFFYVLLFAVESLFFEVLAIPLTGWYVLLLVSTALFCKAKMRYEGSNRVRDILSVCIVAGILGICLLERTVPAGILLEYAVLMGLNFLAALFLNRTSVLKKKIWLLVIAFCYLIVFLLGSLI